jgi:hypothetical protein
LVRLFYCCIILVSDWAFCELGGTYSLPHKILCDRFFVCQNGQTYLGQCDDGMAFMPFNGCKLLHLVNCTGRAKLRKKIFSLVCNYKIAVSVSKSK